MTNKSAREYAMEILLKWEEQEAFSNLLLNQMLAKSGLDLRDRRLVTELVYGCIGRINTLDFLINLLVKKGVRSLRPWVKQLLRLGFYQLLYMDQIPERAAVHETVNIAKKRGHQAVAGLVNGVLRNFLRRKEELMKQVEQTPALFYSHPEWLVRRLVQSYGETEAKKVLEANNTPFPVTARVNRLKGDRDTFLRMWNEQGIGTAHPSMVTEEGVVFERGGNPAHSPFYEEGWITIQDESSMLVGQIVDPKPGMHVLDACAAPGGKTTHLAERMENRGRILACDLYPHKIKLIRRQAERLGIEIIETIHIDSRKLKDQINQTFDAVLLDAPCSGLGVIPRKPEIKWRKDETSIQELVQIQKDLLHAVAPLVKPNGVLVYSTCTWEPQENVEQIEWFMQTCPEFEPDSAFIENLPAMVKERAIVGRSWVQILPHHFHSDGFFICRLRKTRSQ
jgi:16S rRNA (cytosine967-C5)-methyltransferase